MDEIKKQLLEDWARDVHQFLTARSLCSEEQSFQTINLLAALASNYEDAHLNCSALSKKVKSQLADTDNVTLDALKVSKSIVLDPKLKTSLDAEIMAYQDSKLATYYDPRKLRDQFFKDVADIFAGVVGGWESMRVAGRETMAIQFAETVCAPICNLCGQQKTSRETIGRVLSARKAQIKAEQ